MIRRSRINHLFVNSCRYYIILLVYFHSILLVPPKCDPNYHVDLGHHQQFPSSPFAEAQKSVDSTTLKPSIILVSPQSFKVPTNPLQADEFNSSDQTRLQQYVAVINNAQSEPEDQLLRQQYKKLSLQVRDARQPITGQLFYEHVFDYFPPNQRNQHLLVPINLDQVSPVYEQIVPANNHRRNQRLSTISSNNFNSAVNGAIDLETTSITKPQQLIISIRPHQLDSGFGNENVEFVSSAPILVEPVPSHDGRRSFGIVQTDKPVYKPEDKVRIRALVINENLRPIINDEFRLQIKNPHKLVVEEIRFPRQPDSDKSTSNFHGVKQEPLFLDHVFDFPPEPMLGTWSVHLLHSDPIANDTTSFEVKEYVLPPFEIVFDTPRHILPSTSIITGSITAKYHYGRPVQGKVQFKFGFRESLSSKPRYIARSGIKTVDQSSGRVDFKINSEKFKETEWFPAIAGSRLVVEATVTEMSTGHRETAQDISCTFVTTPYRISFDDSIVDFKPGLTQQISVQLVDSLTHQPGPAGERIVATYRDRNGTLLGAAAAAAENRPVNFRERFDTEAITDDLGRAVFSIGPVHEDINQIYVSMKLFNTTQNQIQARLQDRHNLKSNYTTSAELATGQHILNRYDSHNGWISLMNKTTTHLNIGDEFVTDLLIRDNIVTSQKIFYIITARGQIISLDTLNADGLVRFKITESMAPSIRLVLFALTHDSIGLMSDSMRITVNQDVNCGLSMEYVSKDESARPNRSFKPNDSGKILIHARHGDLVSLIGVDSAVYTMNNRTRLDSLRIVERIKRLDTGCGFGGGLNNLDVFHNAGLMLFKDSASIGPNEPMTSYIGSSCLTLQNHLKYLDDAQMGYSKPIFAHLSRLPNIGLVGQRLNIRKKRDVDIDAILKRYKDPTHRACCRLGTLEDLPHHRNCSIRTRIVQKYMHQTEFKSCAQIYLTCCHSVFGEEIRYGSLSPVRELQIEARIIPQQQAPQQNEAVLLPNIGQLDQVEAHTLVRRDFRETWLFDLVQINDEKGEASVDVQLPHSITSWSITAMALNQHKAMCLMPQPYKITAFQEVFIQISMPYKVVQGEQIDLVVKIFNYSPQSQDVLVYMYGIDDVCSEAEPGERSERKRVRMEKHSTQSVLFPMIPLRTGRFPIKIVAVAIASNSSDIVERQLNVVPRGKPVTDETTFSLDPLNQQRRSKRAIQTGNLVDEIDSSRGFQRSKVRLTPSRDSEYIVPQTHECIVSAIGDKLGQTVQTTILDVENLIRLPHGCGEQVMIYLGPTLYTARYLNSINKLTGDIRWRAIRYIQSGYKRILNFRKESGAFSAFAHRDPSVWLTAFVAKLLCQTEKTPFIADEVHVDKTVINSALKWLIDRQNTTTGGWTEWNPVYHREMLGGTLRENVLTAFMAITLNECSHHSPDLVEEIVLEKLDERIPPSSHLAHQQTNGFDKMKLVTQRAEEALILKRMNAVKDKNPYVLALVAYALSSSNPLEATLVLGDLMALAERSQSRNQMFWRGDYQIETAAYALQALIETAPFVAAKEKSSTSGFKLNGSPNGANAISVANWLSSRRSYTGAFESTQDTVVALEALSKWAQFQSTPIASTLLPQSGTSGSAHLTCNVTFNNRTRRSIEFGEDNAQILQTIKLDSFDFDAISGEILDITTSGSGLGTMSVKLKYNVFQEEDELCRFNIDSSIEEWQPVLSMSTRDKPPADHLVRLDDANAHGKDLPVENQSNDTIIEDDYFKTFDKSMLSELNLIDHPNQSESDDSASNNRQHHKTTNSHRNATLTLRMKRFTETVESSRPGDLINESWTSKMVSTIRSKLPSWIIPKSSGGLHPVSHPSNLGSPTSANQSSIRPTSEGPRRAGTSRRSAHSIGAPIVNVPTGVPTGVHLNSLSDQLEIGSRNKSSNSSNSTMSYQLTSSELSHRLILLLRICVHHMAKRDSEMSVIEIGILSGFKPNEADLKEIINDTGTPAMKYELSPDRSLVIIYMQHIPNSGPYCLQFRLVRDALVYNLQSGYIRVYEYYSPRHSCSNFYTPSRVTDLIRTKCDSTGQVCQCASKSLCPATNKLVQLGEIQQVNATSARNQLIDLVCSNRFDLVSLVRLKSVRYLEAGKMFKLSVRVKSDLKGNLTKIVQAQRQQKAQLINSVRKPQHTSAAISDISSYSDQPTTVIDELSGDDTSLDHLSMTIDSGCVRDDPFLLHLAHPSQWKQGGELMILFARLSKIEKKLFKSTAKQSTNTNSRSPTLGPRPKVNVWGNRENLLYPSRDQASIDSFHAFEDIQQLQYSLQLSMDKDTILHDLTYQPKTAPREAINNLILWFELRSRRERWSCQ